MIISAFRRFGAASLLTACALALAGCSDSANVKTDFDAATNFGAYRSYSWVYTTTPAGMNPLVFQRVHDSIDRALQARYTPGAPGDFAVAFTVGRRDSVQVTDFGPYGPYYRGWGWGGAYRNVDVRNVTSGTLVVDIYDTRTKKAVWHGVAEKEVNPDKVPDQATIDSVVAQVLAKFPPAAGGSN